VRKECLIPFRRMFHNAERYRCGHGHGDASQNARSAMRGQQHAYAMRLPGPRGWAEAASTSEAKGHASSNGSLSCRGAAVKSLSHATARGRLGLWGSDLWRCRPSEWVNAAMICDAPCAILCQPTSVHGSRQAKYLLCFWVVCDMQHCAPLQRWLDVDGERRGADIARPSPRWRGSAVAPPSRATSGKHHHLSDWQSTPTCLAFKERSTLTTIHFAAPLATQSSGIC